MRITTGISFFSSFTPAQLIFSLLIEPNLGEKYPIFVHSFPATQASLAKINEFDSRISDRFELYYKGLELANGFHELSDHVEQNNRFNNDNLNSLFACS